MTEIEDWNYISLGQIKSTNDEARQYCIEPNQKTIVRAESQTAGRGRRGRKWASGKGNLYFSMAFEFDLKNVGNLVMISSLSLAQVIEEYNPNARPSLKWPNDVLINNCKLSGILIEKGEGNYVIMGIGINVATTPKKKYLLYKATSLHENDINCTAEEFLIAYVKKFNQNMMLLQKAQKLMLRGEWLKRACGIGQQITVCRENKVERGIFVGIDENMALLLNNRGRISKILAGDVFFNNGDVR